MRAPQGIAESHRRDVTLTVFMEGTANPMSEVTTQIALFSRMCVAKELPTDFQGLREDHAEGHFKLSFAGCGVTHGIRGTLFASGLREQCEVVRQYVDAFLKGGATVKLNFLGLSRGGIGGVYLAQHLSDIPVENMVLNLLLFDPVPGNFVWMASIIDMAGIMNANQAMDASEVKNLGSVLVLYPHEPLPDLAVHAPLLVQWPDGCQVEEDVILGCHQGALFLRPHADTCLSFNRIWKFLVEHGTDLDQAAYSSLGLNLAPAKLAKLLEQELDRDVSTERIAHSPTSGKKIVRHRRGTYLNRTHEALLRQLGEQPRPKLSGDVPYYMLDFQD